MYSRLVLLAVFIATGAAILGYFSLAQSIHSNAIIAPTPNQVLSTIMYTCITQRSPQQNAFMDGYKMGAIHAISGQLYANNSSKNMHYCSLYQTGYVTGWDKYIWVAEHTCYRCV